MELKPNTALLRIFLGESDKYHHGALYEKIVNDANSQGLAGATVTRGIMSFGASSRIRSEKILNLSYDLPLVIEIVDEREKLDEFLPIVNELFASSKSGGLVTIEDVQVIRYRHGEGEQP